MTTITSYNELKQNVLDYSKRSAASVNSKIDSWIDLAEVDIWNVVRLPEMDENTTLNTNTTDRFVALPSDFIEARRLQIDLANLPPCDLTYKAPKQLRILDKAGIPYAYTVTDQFELNRISDQVYTLELQYYKELTPLSASNASNAVLANHPMIYLAGCMKYFSIWARREPQELAQWDTMFNQQVAFANRRARRARVPAASGGRVAGMIV